MALVLRYANGRKVRMNDQQIQRNVKKFLERIVGLCFSGEFYIVSHTTYQVVCLTHSVGERTGKNLVILEYKNYGSDKGIKF